MDILKILELLKRSGLFSEEEISIMKGYLYGDADDEVLAQFKYHDLTNMYGASELCTQYQEFLDRKEYNLAGKLGKLFFALGQVSACVLYPMDFFYCPGAKLWTESSPKAAVFAMKMAMNECQADRETFLKLFRIAEQKPDNLLKAMEYEAGGLHNGKLVLQAAYFAMRYPRGQRTEMQEDSLTGMSSRPESDTQNSVSGQPETDTQSSAGEQSELDTRSSMGKPAGTGIRRVMGRLFVPGSCSMQLGEQDKQILEEYERSLIRLIPVIYEKVHEEADIQRIVKAMESGQMNSIIRLAGASWGRINTFHLTLAAKCAYLNYTLSARIKNIVTLCLTAKMEVALDGIAQVDLYNELEKNGGNFDVIFAVGNQNLIKWAARNNRNEILRIQFGRNPEGFMTFMYGVEYDIYNVMARIVEEMDMGRYQKWLGKEAVRQQLKLVETFANGIGSLPHAVGTGLGEDVRGYLLREKGVEVAYACREILKDEQWGYRVRTELWNYQKHYGCDGLSDRCEVLLALGHGFGFVSYNFNSGPGYKVTQKKPSEVLERLFAAMEHQGVDVYHQLDAYAFLYDNDGREAWEEMFLTEGKVRFGNYLRQRRAETLEAFQKVGSTGRMLGLEVLSEEAEENQAEILKFAQDTSKGVRETLLRILYARKDWEAGVAALLQAKKASVREMGVRVLAKWLEEISAPEAGADAETGAVNAEVREGGLPKAGTGAVNAEVREDGLPETGIVTEKKSLREKYIQILKQALEKEKNTKVRDLLEKVLQVSGEESEGGISRDDLVKEIHKGNKKRVLAWAYGTPFSKVHRKDGKEAEEAYLQAVLLCYYSMSPCGVSQSASFLADSLNAQEFAVYMGELFDKWVEAGADTKRKWVLYASAVHGGARMVNQLHRRIQEWPKEARSAVAVEAVQALALSPEKQALVIVDQMSRKCKYNKVKAAAGKAMDFAASQLGVGREELEDRIVPDLGFDGKMQRIFDYGSRRFTAVITTSLEIEVFDENNKKLKSLPAPGKRDDELKAAKAYEEFKELKKQLKTTVSSQKIRMESALSNGRQWSISAWKKLFVENPVMHQFAIALVWGIYEDGKLKESFRYMEDGSYNTEEGAEYVLQGDKADILSGERKQTVDDREQSIGRDRGIAQGQVIAQDQVIGLVHPIELSETSLNAWKEQLSDYELLQPIVQLGRPVYYKTEEEANLKKLERFQGIIVNGLALGGTLKSLGWYRGVVEDDGRFYTYDREDQKLSLGAKLHFSGNYVSSENEDVTVHEVSFFKAGDLAEGGVNPQMKEEMYPLKDLPDRYFSEIVLQISRATASGRFPDSCRLERRPDR